MQLDLNKFRTLVPVNNLFEDALRYLAHQVSIHILHEGEPLSFAKDDKDVIHYLIQGVLTSKGIISNKQLIPGNLTTRHPLPEQQLLKDNYIVTSDKATIISVPADELEKLLLLQEDEYENTDKNRKSHLCFDGPNANDSEWMIAMMGTGLFKQLPADSIHAIFDFMEKVYVKKGDTIIQQGDKGEYYYALRQGVASVYRENVDSKIRLATLNPPECFGEESLLTNTPRTASIRMNTDGVLMRLSASAFREFMRQPLIKQVTLTQADDLVRQGAARIDVRNENEFAKDHLSSANNIPLYMLRLKAAALRRDRKYVIYCADGQRSQVAAYILYQLGYSAYVLEGGLIQARKTEGKYDMPKLDSTVDKAASQ